MAFDQPAKTCHVSPAECGPRGENKGKSCHERTGWCWWQWCWMKRVCPLAVSAAYPSLTPLYLSLSLVCFLPRCGYLLHTTECIPPRLYEYTTTPREISTATVTHMPRKPTTKLPKENPKATRYLYEPCRKTHLYTEMRAAFV